MTLNLSNEKTKLSYTAPDNGHIKVYTEDGTLLAMIRLDLTEIVDVSSMSKEDFERYLDGERG